MDYYNTGMEIRRKNMQPEIFYLITSFKEVDKLL
jgi:hypothetical protein